jgi:hypothetical protein
MLAAIVALGAGAQRSEAKVPAEFFGMLSAAPLQPTDYELMEGDGVGMLRGHFYWPVLEPAPGAYEWEYFDPIVSAAATHGIRVFPTFYGTPSWVNLLSGHAGCGAGCAPDAESSRNAAARFLRAAAERYGPNGEFWRETGGGCGIPALCPIEPPACGCANPMPVKAWQIWNEQNSPKYYKPTPDPREYATFLGSAANAIRSVDPTAQVVMGGMWGPPETDAVVPTVDYLKEFYRAPGAKDTFDAIAVHPYSPTLAGVRDQIKDVRRVMKQAGDGRTGVWVTELGWASSGPREEGLVKTRKGQARLLDKSYRLLIKKRRAWKIKSISWYTWRDAGPGESDCAWCPKAGLRTRGGKLKPAGRKFRKVTQQYGIYAE